MAGMFMVTQDGRPLKRGLSKSEAERYADYLAHGYESRRANEKNRVAEFDVKPDNDLKTQLDRVWTRT